MSATAESLQEGLSGRPPVQVIDPEKQYEYVNGHVEVKEMPGARHSRIGTRLIIELGIYLKAHPVGELYGPDATLTIGTRERMPDAFVAAARIPPEGDPLGILDDCA